MNFYPLKFRPVYKEKIWGGIRLNELFERGLPTNQTGESWEVASHPNGQSIVSNGNLTGTELSTLINNYPGELLGQDFRFKEKVKFPLLIKLLDARKKLSVQVHPGNKYARRVEGEEGKTEMWYILDARPGAKLIYGLKPGTTRSELSRAITENQLGKYLNEIEVQKGDIIYIPSGTVHAIGEGILLAEIQQNSDATYRVFDWNRTGKNGKPRHLHIDKAIDVINFSTKPFQAKSKPLILKKNNYVRSFLTACPYFVTEKISIYDIYQISPAKKRFYILIFINGQGTINHQSKKFEIKAGETIFLPADLENVQIKGNLDFIKTYLPESRKKTISKLIDLGFSKENIENLSGMKDW